MFYIYIFQNPPNPSICSCSEAQLSGENGGFSANSRLQSTSFISWFCFGRIQKRSRCNLMHFFFLESLNVCLIFKFIYVNLAFFLVIQKGIYWMHQELESFLQLESLQWRPRLLAGSSSYPPFGCSETSRKILGKLFWNSYSFYSDCKS